MSERRIRFSELCSPLPRQREAWAAVDRKKYVLYGGARGPGKSYWLRWTCIRQLLKWATMGLKGVRVGLFSVDYPTLKDRQIGKAEMEFPDWLGDWNKVDHEFRLKPAYGGGVVCFRNLDDPSKYKSAEFALVAVEELTENQRTVFDALRGSLRWPGVDEVKFIAATNPGGVGHLWVKQLWIDRDFPPELESVADQFEFIRALPGDNPHLNESYLLDLATLAPSLRRAWLEGDWTVFEGQVFDEWRDELHVTDREPPSVWRFAAAVDYGYRNPGCFVIGACGPDSDVCIAHELYFRELTAFEAGKACGELVRDSELFVEYVAGDSAMWAKTGVGPTVAEGFQEGLNAALKEDSPPLWEATKGPGSRSAGVLTVHRYLQPIIDKKTGKMRAPPRLTFHRRAKHCIRTIPALPYDPTNSEDVDTDAEDHAYDAVRYFLMSRPPLAQRPGLPSDPDRHPGLTQDGERKRKTAADWWFEQHAPHKGKTLVEVDL